MNRHHVDELINDMLNDINYIKMSVYERAD